MKIKHYAIVLLFFLIQTSINAQFATENFITFQLPAVWHVTPGDINGNGYIDIVAIVRNFPENDFRITSFRNNADGSGTFSQEIPIDLDADPTKAIDLADFDGDGDLDIIRTSVQNDKIVWYRNLDGNGNYSSEIMISELLESPNDVVSGDFDGDGDMDFTACSGDQNRIYWFENEDGNASFDDPIAVTSQILTPVDLDVADIDGDGDLDIVSLSTGDRKIAWFENLDGLGTFSTPRLVTTEALNDSRLKVVDIDSDGDTDLVSSSSGRISWYQNLDGLGDFDTRINVTWSGFSIWDIAFGDFEEDGDPEIFYASNGSNGQGYLGYFRNLDGAGTYGISERVSEIEQPTTVSVADANGDGDLDLIANSYNKGWIVWYDSSEVLSVENFSQSKYSIYPVPSSDIINIQSESIIAKVDIYNLLGKLVLSNKDQSSIDISQLSNGMYLMRVQDILGGFETIKVLKN